MAQSAGEGWGSHTWEPPRPVFAQRREDRELLRGQAGRPEQRQPLGQRDDPGTGTQGHARRVDPLGGIRPTDAGP